MRTIKSFTKYMVPIEDSSARSHAYITLFMLNQTEHNFTCICLYLETIISRCSMSMSLPGNNFKRPMLMPLSEIQ